MNFDVETVGGGYGLGGGNSCIALIIFALILVAMFHRRDGHGYDGPGYGGGWMGPELLKDQAEDTGDIIHAIDQQTCEIDKAIAELKDCQKSVAWDIERREMQRDNACLEREANDLKRRLELKCVEDRIDLLIARTPAKAPEFAYTYSYPAVPPFPAAPVCGG